MFDQGRVNQASEGLREMHREIIQGDKQLWHFVSTGNDFLLADREVQVAALEKYNRELRNDGTSELQLSPADFARFL